MFIKLKPVMLRLHISIIGPTVITWINKFKPLKDNKMKWIKNLIERIKLEIRYRKKLKELRKRDPFIYK